MFIEQLGSLGIRDILLVLGIAASPISELRGAIPYAVSVLKFPWYYAFLISVIGNLMPVPFILLFLEKATVLLSKVPLFERIINWFFERTRRRGKVVERYERIGLTLFVAIPLPITGAWTGSLLAVLFGVKLKHAFLAILGGVIISGAIVTTATMLGWAMAGFIHA